MKALLRDLFQSEAMVSKMISLSPNLAPRVRLTIGLCYYLSNCIQAFFATAGFEFKFNEKNRNRTKRLEVISDLASVSYMAIEDRFWQISKCKTKLSDQAIKDLRTTV